MADGPMLMANLPLAAAELAVARVAEPPPPPDVPDLFPPFASLSTEEDWQHKAEYQPPGTYYVVANPRSFAGHGKYRSEGESTDNEDEDVELGSSSRRTRPENVLVDPVTVILGSFDDEPPSAITPSSATQRTAPAIPTTGSKPRRSTRRSPSRSPPSSSPSPLKKVSFAVGGASIGAPQTSSPSAITTAVPVSQKVASSYRSLPPLSIGVMPSTYAQSTATDTETPTTPSIPLTPATDFSELALIRHYRTFVRRHLLQVSRNSVTGADDLPDAFEREAASFQPVRQPSHYLVFARPFLFEQSLVPAPLKFLALAVFGESSHMSSSG